MVKHTIKKTILKSVRYDEGTGRRKTSSARVRIMTSGDKEVDEKKHTQTNSSYIIVNDKPLDVYFPLANHRRVVLGPLSKLGLLGLYKATVKVYGGGVSSQAQAIRHGLARALVKKDEALKKKLKDLGFLTRDARMVERKKYGLKKARKAPQWSKR